MIGLMAVVVALSLLLFRPAQSEPTPFAVGQVWSVKAPAAASLRVRIGRIDDLSGRRIVSIAVTGIPCLAGMGCETTTVGHMPFAEETLRSDLDRLVEQGVGNDERFEGGYAQWREAQGGYWTIPLAQALAAVMQTLFNASQHLPGGT